MKIKRDAIADFLQRWLMPIMAIVGWLLLIIFYVTMIGGDGPEKNLPPEIIDIQVNPNPVQTGQIASVRVFVKEPDGDEIHYIWDCVKGRIQLDPHQDDLCTYIPPDLPGVDTIKITVYDRDGTDKYFTDVTIMEGGKE